MPTNMASYCSSSRASSSTTRASSRASSSMSFRSTSTAVVASRRFSRMSQVSTTSTEATQLSDSGDESLDLENLETLDTETVNRLTREACAKGDLERLQSLMTRGPDVNEVDVRGVSCLLCAVMTHQPRVVQYLLQAAGANPNIAALNGMTSLHYGARWGNPVMVHELLAAKSWLDAADQDGWTPLHHCCVNDHTDAGDLLLFMTATANAKTKAGHTPSSMALSSKMEQIINPYLKVPRDVLSRSCKFMSTRLTTRGGLLDFPGIGVQLDIPDGALKTEVLLTLRRMDPECYSKLVKVKDGYTVAAGVIELRPRRLRFRKPIRITIEIPTETRVDEDAELLLVFGKTEMADLVVPKGKVLSAVFETKRLQKMVILQKEEVDYSERYSDFEPEDDHDTRHISAENMSNTDETDKKNNEEHQDNDKYIDDMTEQ